jgi:hypothetical protein
MTAKKQDKPDCTNNPILGEKLNVIVVRIDRIRLDSQRSKLPTVV